MISCPVLIAKCLRKLGTQNVFGLVGVPVTPIAEALADEDIQFWAHRCETAAGYAAAGYGYLAHAQQKGPSVLLSTGGPGFINALAGLSHATVNRMPLVVLSGSAGLSLRGKGAFQELDQVAICKKNPAICKAAFACTRVDDVVTTLAQAFMFALSGEPGGVYVDLPRDILESSVADTDAETWLSSGVVRPYEQICRTIPGATDDCWAWIRSALAQAEAPLLIAGEAVAMEAAEEALRRLCHNLSLPVLPTAMGRGTVEDTDALCVSAVRSRVLREADLVFVVGTRLNWMLHYGEPPKWNPSVKIVAIDYEATNPTASSQVALALNGDIKRILEYLDDVTLKSIGLNAKARAWVTSVVDEATARRRHGPSAPRTKSREYMSFRESMGIVRDFLEAWKSAAGGAGRRITLIAEGSQTMDISRTVLPVDKPRGRLDAGTWGTMGVGLGYCVAAFAADSSDQHLIVAAEGDSALGFSIGELETIVRYNIPALVLVFNNGGIYSGASSPTTASTDRRPAPTQLSQATRYEDIMKAAGGLGGFAQTPEQLRECLVKLGPVNRPRLIHILVDPFELSTGLP